MVKRKINIEDVEGSVLAQEFESWKEAFFSYAYTTVIKQLRNKELVVDEDVLIEGKSPIRYFLEDISPHTEFRNNDIQGIFEAMVMYTNLPVNDLTYQQLFDRLNDTTSPEFMKALVTRHDFLGLVKDIQTPFLTEVVVERFEFFVKPEDKEYAKGAAKLLQLKSLPNISRLRLLSSLEKNDVMDKFMRQMPPEQMDELAAQAVRKCDEDCIDVLRKYGFDFSRPYKNAPSFMCFAEDNTAILALKEAGLKVTAADILYITEERRYTEKDVKQLLINNAEPGVIEEVKTHPQIKNILEKMLEKGQFSSALILLSVIPGETARHIDFGKIDKSAFRDEYCCRDMPIDKEALSLFEFMAKASGETHIERLCATVPESSDRGIINKVTTLNSVLPLLAKPYCPVSIRLQFAPQLAEKLPDVQAATPEKGKFVREVPKPLRTGGFGTPYRFAGAYMAVKEIRKIAKELGIEEGKRNGFIKRTIAATSGDWADIGEKARAADSRQIGDSFKEVAGYMARYSFMRVVPSAVIKRLPDELVKEILDSHLEKHFVRYMVKDKAVDSLVSLSDLWHQKRSAVLDGARDFASENQWHTLFTKNKIAVKAPAGNRANGMTIVNLTTAVQLTEEGRDLKHCVGGYESKCLEGKTHIFSIRNAEGRSVSTFELEKSSEGELDIGGTNYTVVQHRGFDNSEPPRACREAMKWFERQVRTQRLDPNPELGDTKCVKKLHMLENSSGLKIPTSAKDRDKLNERIEKNMQVLGSNVEGAPRLHASKNNGGRLVRVEDAEKGFLKMLEDTGIKEFVEANTSAKLRKSVTNAGASGSDKAGAGGGRGGNRP